MIPKVIHYCAFGNPQKSALLEQCRESWERYCPNYEIMEWNDETFTPYRIPFFEEAIAQRKFAFASDYARAFVLKEFGGIYLDTDVELRKPLDPFLSHRAFTGFEVVGFPFTAVWGSEKGHSLAGLVVDHYLRAEFSTVTNTKIVSDLIAERYGIDRHRDDYQEGADGLAVYPSSTLCVDLDGSVAVHHFAGSWVARGNKHIPYKTVASVAYHANKLSELNGWTAPVMFNFINRDVGIFRYMTWLSYRSGRHYARKAINGAKSLVLQK